MSVDDAERVVFRRPRLNRGVDPRLTRDGTVYLLRGGDACDVVLEGADTWIVALLRLLDGTRDLPELAADLARSTGVDDAGAVVEALAELDRAGLLEDDVSDPDLLDGYSARRYDRQIGHFAELLGSGDAGAHAQRRLLDSHVCILGMGGLGSWCAWALACAGVGHITGVDGDVLELSNLNRQITYNEADLGQAKAVAAGRRLQAFSATLRYTPIVRRLDGAEAVADVIAGADLVVDGADWPAHLIGAWVNRACFAAGIPYIAMSQHPPDLRVGPLYVPGVTGCFECQQAAYRERFPLYEILEDAEQLFAPSGSYGPMCGMVATWAAGEVLSHLAGLRTPATLGTALLMDTAQATVELEPVVRRAGCPICARSGREAYAVAGG